jgi:predicted phosphate transport protein (TIGR00153 family)
MTFGRLERDRAVKHFLKALFGTTQRQIQADLDEYLANLDAIALDMREAVRTYLAKDEGAFLSVFDRINKTENHLDALRRAIEEQIYAHRLLPDTRDDILALLEGLDKIPNRMQAITREMMLQRLRIPPNLHQSVTDLTERDTEIVQVLTQASRAFLTNPRLVRQSVQRLSQLEHEGDLVEHQALKLIFGDDSLVLAEKLQLNHFIDRLGSICDMAEDRGDEIMIWALKRLL